MTTLREFYCIGHVASKRQLRGEVLSQSGARSSRRESEKSVRCPLNPKHQPLTKLAWDEILRSREVSAQLKHNRRDYMMIWTTPWEHCLIHDRLANVMQGQGFTGYSLAPAEVQFRDGQESRDYHRFAITGWGGLARQESGIRLVSECRGCTLREYSPLKDPRQLIDESQWSGEDFFIVWPLYNQRFVTGRVAEYFRSAKIESCVVRPLVEISDDIDYPLGFRHATFSTTVGSVTEMYPPELARKYRRPPEIV